MPFTQYLCIAILDCYRTGSSSQNLIQHLQQHAAVFLQLPHPAWFSEYAYVKIHHSPCVPLSVPKADNMAFYPTHNSGLLAVELKISADHIAGPHTFAIPSSVLFSVLAKGKADMRTAGMEDDDLVDYPSFVTVLPWSAWGCNTRYMGSGKQNRIVSICDSRCARVETVGNQRVVVIYDFASVPALLEDVVSSGTLPPPPVSLEASVPSGIVWDSVMVTSAPCRRVVTDIVMGEQDRVWLYRDGLVVQRDGERSVMNFKRHICLTISNRIFFL